MALDCLYTSLCTVYWEGGQWTVIELMYLYFTKIQAVAGFEPAISCLRDRRFNQLSHTANYTTSYTKQVAPIHDLCKHSGPMTVTAIATALVENTPQQYVHVSSKMPSATTVARKATSRKYTAARQKA